ncbi:MAG: membrane dipeptidase [Rhodocyclaceae bacterium]|nr:membrane dipeptidase [Rhodocyclaceae bacterium]
MTGGKLGDIMTAPAVSGGITDLGRAVLVEMNKAGIIVDLAHAAEATAFGALAVAAAQRLQRTHTQFMAPATPPPPPDAGPAGPRGAPPPPRPGRPPPPPPPPPPLGRGEHPAAGGPLLRRPPPARPSRDSSRPSLPMRLLMVVV